MFGVLITVNNVTSASRCAIFWSSAHLIERVFWLANARSRFIHQFKLRSVRLETVRRILWIEFMEINATLEHHSWEFKVHIRPLKTCFNRGSSKMRLRSRNILNENPTTPCRRRRAAPETPGTQTQVRLSVSNTTYEKQTKLVRACVWVWVWYDWACVSVLSMICTGLVSMMLTDLKQRNPLNGIKQRYYNIFN